MANGKKIHHIAGTGFSNNGDYSAQRNIKASLWPWIPASERGMRQPSETFNKSTYLFDHNNNRIKLKSGDVSGDTQNRGTAYGMGQWSPDGNRSNVAGHSVNKNKPYHHWSVYGWDGTYKSDSAVADLKRAKCAPISDFIGITFKWDGKGSYWSNRAISLEADFNVTRSPSNDTEGGVSLNVYNAKTNKIHSMYTFRKSYHGHNIFTDRQDGGNDATDNNWVYFEMASTDQDYVLNNPVYLIGLNIQCYNDDRGSSSHTRTLNFWDLNPIFNPAIGGTYEQGGAKMVLPAAYDGALGDMYNRFNRNQRVPMMINVG